MQATVEDTAAAPSTNLAQAKQTAKRNVPSKQEVPDTESESQMAHALTANQPRWHAEAGSANAKGECPIYESTWNWNWPDDLGIIKAPAVSKPEQPNSIGREPLPASVGKSTQLRPWEAHNQIPHRKYDWSTEEASKQRDVWLEALAAPTHPTMVTAEPSVPGLTAQAHRYHEEVVQERGRIFR